VCGDRLRCLVGLVSVSEARIVSYTQMESGTLESLQLTFTRLLANNFEQRRQW
jgi:hypothetical protein